MMFIDRAGAPLDSVTEKTVHDKELEDRASATFAPQQIGRTRYRTPEGYLLCEGARLARTGAMMYSNAEMKGAVRPNPSGAMVTILRDAEVLFHPDAVASFNGKSVTNDHPTKMVTPTTYRDVDVGVGMNIRRGEGADAHYLVGDLLIKHAKAIADVEAGKCEISLGYDAEIEELAPGLGRQTKITGNHIALVRRGRAGPECAIQDQDIDPHPKETAMTARTIWDRLRTAFEAKDKAAFDEELGKAQTELAPAGAGGVHIHLGDNKPAKDDAADGDGEPIMDAKVDARFKALEDGQKAILDSLAKMIPTADEEAEAAKKKADEEAAAAAAAKAKEDGDDKEADKKEVADAAAKAEIIAPGIRLPAMDGAVKTSAVVSLKREALVKALADTKHKPILDALTGGKTVDFATMDGAALTIAFDSAAALIGAANNRETTRAGMTIPGAGGGMTTAKYADMIKERRAKKA